MVLPGVQGWIRDAPPWVGATGPTGAVKLLACANLGAACGGYAPVST